MARGKEKYMKILDKYISKHFIIILLSSNLVTVLLFLLISVFDSLGGLMVKKELPLIKIVQFFSYQIPQISYYAAPLSVLFGLLLTLGVLAQRSELTIMRVSGLNWLQLMRWPIIFTAVYAWLIYLVGGYIIPLANQQSKAFEKLEIEKETRLPGTDLWVFDSKDPQNQHAVYIFPQAVPLGTRQAAKSLWTRRAASPLFSWTPISPRSGKSGPNALFTWVIMTGRFLTPSSTNTARIPRRSWKSGT